MYGWAGFDRPDGALRPSYNRAASHRFLAKPESSILNRAMVNANVWYSYQDSAGSLDFHPRSRFLD